ncbi:hypothetical protein ATI53_102456 [Salipiger aestuarii]|uniref:Uncharacterized protein n=1 Tax=Salipiger aestuarii TaxID=568098 RepID=A0A327Y2I6_9RHOB|nr:hypothetical protein [Salipiger aestuarii]RAK15300.1 hypothetical protein ATI53_102456 [Salipiger aestuarii]
MRLLALLLVIATQLAARPPSAQQTVDGSKPPRPLVSVIARRQSLPQFDFVGAVAARIAVDLGFPMIGTVAERPVSPGDRGDAANGHRYGHRRGRQGGARAGAGARVRRLRGQAKPARHLVAGG